MPPERALRHRAALSFDLPVPWRAGLLRLGLAWLALIAAFAEDWRNIVGQWWNSSTYNHMLLVPPIVGWLMWQRKDQILRLAPRVWWPGLGAVTAALLIWVLGAISGLDLMRQAGVVALLPTSLLTLVGPKVFAGLLFPLCYMALMVPFGDEFVPALQKVTAALTIGLVNLSGIPASIEGVFIDTPAGLFEVAEACSGVKFLVAMVALGILVGHIGFRSWSRRLAFMALCIAAPILANGVRAFGTVYVAQFVGAERAGGIDHIVYGWFFFALVIALVLALAWRFFDRAIDDPFIDARTIEASPWLTRLERASTRPLPAMVGLIALTVAALVWVQAADRLAAPLPLRIALPDVPGWHRIDYAPRAAWDPRAAGSDHRLLGRYADAAGNEVDVFFALYDSQREGKEAGGFGEGALRHDQGWSWLGDDAAFVDARVDRLRSNHGVERYAATFYRTGDLLTGSNAALKLAAIRDHLILHPQPTMLLILSAEERPGHAGKDAVAAFRRGAEPLGSWMDRIGTGR